MPSVVEGSGGGGRAGSMVREGERCCDAAGVGGELRIETMMALFHSVYDESQDAHPGGYRNRVVSVITLIITF